ncbi:hypothetical protein LC612_12185 [Nostoc sp. CHAB 5834]|nr:hypothetical protein [Nostoc sp. CHAB 5834]
MLKAEGQQLIHLGFTPSLPEACLRHAVRVRQRLASRREDRTASKS